MILKVFKTGSTGNGYSLCASNGEVLLIECGVKLDVVKRALNFDLSRVVGCLMSHSHQDHSKYSKGYANAGIEIYGQRCSFDGVHHNFKSFEQHEGMFFQHTIGEFTVLPFRVKHDVPCVGFIIHHPECGKVVFITDTYYCPFKFENINHFIVEANYSTKIINENYKGDKFFLKNRIKHSHMSLENCIELLKSNDMTNVKNIVLIHLSDTNSDEAYFKNEVERATGKVCTIADSGVDVDLIINS